jgi:hypothetical protein
MFIYNHLLKSFNKYGLEFLQTMHVNHWDLSFNLRGVLLWIIHDFLGYGVVVKIAHQRFATCPICDSNFRGEHYWELGNLTYTQTHRWLLMGTHIG